MGVLLHDFRPGRRKKWLVITLGFVVIGVGIGALLLMWEPGRGLPRQARGLGIVFISGVLLLYLGFFAFGNTRVLITSSEVILITPWRGQVRQILARVRETCLWEDVAEVVVTSEDVVTSHKGRTNTVTHTVCRLVRKDGTRLELRETDRADIEPVLTALRFEAEARGIRWR